MSSKIPKVSVIVPVFNVEDYLEKCLNSIICQTLYEIEIICIDDCSVDNSLKILTDFSKNDKRIKVVEFKQKQNAAMARNVGLIIATGEYLGFVDSDDYIDHDFYEKLYKKAKDDDSEIVKAKRKEIYNNGTVFLGNLNDKIKKSKFNFTYEWQSAIYKSLFVKRNKIMFPNECPKAQDIVFLNECVLKAQKISLIDDVFYYHIKRAGSLDSHGICLDYVISGLRAVDLILAELNNTGLYYENKSLYIDSYNRTLGTIFHILYKNYSSEVKLLCAKALIKAYHSCLNIDMLDDVFPYRILVDFIKYKSIDGLFEAFKEYETRRSLVMANTVSELRNNVKLNMGKK